MKKTMPTIVAFLLVLGMAVVPQAQAKDSCETFLCMAGEATGSGGGSSCKPAISDFFSIIVFGSHGQMLTGHTADKRRDFLQSCQGADPDMISKIISQFGRSFGL